MEGEVRGEQGKKKPRKSIQSFFYPTQQVTEPGFEPWPLGSREYSLSPLPVYPVQEGLPEASGSFASLQDTNTARTPSIPFLPSPASSLGHNRAPTLCSCFLLEVKYVFPECQTQGAGQGRLSSPSRLHPKLWASPSSHR